MQGHVHSSQQQMVAAAIRQVFAVDELVEARARLAGVVAGLEEAAPKVALLLEAAEEELLAFMAFPREHWTKLRSTSAQTPPCQPRLSPAPPMGGGYASGGDLLT
jgi:transposase-like protein